MIVALAGRQRSGKTTLASHLCGRGYKRLSFAGRLKHLVGDIYGWDDASMSSEEGKAAHLDKPAVWSLFESEYLGHLIDAKRPLWPLHPHKREFGTRREALQFIGTEVLRAYDDEFHLKAVREEIAANRAQDFVLDDCRFMNELQVMRELAAVPIYIMRPAWYEYFDHPSETELRRRHFRYSIVNDGPLGGLLRGFRRLLEVAEEERQRPGGPLMVADRDGWHGCDHEAFAEPSPRAAYWAGFVAATGGPILDGTPGVRVTLSEGRQRDLSGFRGFVNSSRDTAYEDRNISLYVRSPLMAEDLKLWGLGASPGRHRRPYFCEGDRELLGRWVMGLCDGAGHRFHGPVRLRLGARVAAEVCGWGGLPEPNPGGGEWAVVEAHGDEAEEFRRRVYPDDGVWAEGVRAGMAEDDG